MSLNGKPTIDRIDHGVLPSNDLGRAHRFYSTFMGGELDHLTNLTIRGLNREVPQILFYTLANHKGWGLALQDFPIASTPARPLEGVVYGFEVAADNLADVVRAAEERKLKIHGPMSYARTFADQRIAFCPRSRRQHIGTLRAPRSDEATNRRARSCRCAESATCAWK